MRFKKRNFKTRDFRPGSTLKRDAYDVLKQSHAVYFKRSLIVTLIFFIMIFEIFKRAPHPSVKAQETKWPGYFYVENVPVTRQENPLPKPSRPVVPVPAEEADVPEDIIINETTNLTVSNVPVPLEGGGAAEITPPRPIAEVWPKYPEKEKKRGVQGTVKLALQVNKDGSVTDVRSEEHTSELQSHSFISYAVFCLKKKK